VRAVTAACRSAPERPVVCRDPVAFGAGLVEEETVRKGPTYVGGFVGSFGGSFVPSIWGAGQLSASSIVMFMIGGIAGIWLAYRLFA
jgi:hypothetical protein